MVWGAFDRVGPVAVLTAGGCWRPITVWPLVADLLVSLVDSRLVASGGKPPAE